MQTEIPQIWEREKERDEAFATVVGRQEKEEEGRASVGRRSFPTLDGGENYPAAVPRPPYLVCSFSVFGMAAFVFCLFFLKD